MPTMQPWHDFFILTGTAAATLLGLVFLASTIAATIWSSASATRGTSPIGSRLGSK